MFIPPPGMLSSAHGRITGLMYGLGQKPREPAKPQLSLNSGPETQVLVLGFGGDFISKSWQVGWEPLSDFPCQLIVAY